MPRIAKDEPMGGESWIPEDESGRKAVRDELARLLASDELRASKRYAKFLTFGVEHYLLHGKGSLKERTVGIEVFGRPPSYDTSSDPIVRVTAAELRKRITHYYDDPAHNSELRILLPIGSYLPIFLKPVPDKAEGSASSFETKLMEAPPTPPESDPRNLKSSLPRKGTGFARNIIWWSVLTVVVVTAGLSRFLVVHRVQPASPLGAFWAPIMKSRGPVLICMADQPPQKTILLRDADNPLLQTKSETTIQRPASVALADTVPMLAVANLMHARGRRYRVEGQGTVTLSDLRQGPDVLIGAYDNAWTLTLTEGLRFHFANDSKMNMWIVDKEHPEQRKWMRHIPTGKETAYTDYGLVARFIDSATGQETVIAAGLGDGGTAAAGEVFSNPDVFHQIESRLAPSLENRNVEMVIATTVIDGQHSSPQILAVNTW